MAELGALIRETGHPPGLEHEDEGTTAEIRPAGTPPASPDPACADADWLAGLADLTL